MNSMKKRTRVFRNPAVQICLCVGLLVAVFAVFPSLKPRADYNSDVLALFRSGSVSGAGNSTVQNQKGPKSLQYRLMVPYNYSYTSQSYPLVLFLHGHGESGTDNQKQILNSDPLACDSGGNPLTSSNNRVNYPCFYLAPQVPNDPDNYHFYNRWVNWDCLQDPTGYFDKTPETNAAYLTYALIQQLLKQYRIDPSRIYVTGISMGGSGTYDIIMRYPKLFAAAAPMAGAGDSTKASLLKGMPIWSFHGAKDLGVAADGKTPYGCPVSFDEKIWNVLKTIDSNFQSTLMNTDHGCWYQACETSDVIDWMFSQHRTDIPTSSSQSTTSQKIVSNAAGGSGGGTAGGGTVTNSGGPGGGTMGSVIGKTVSGASGAAVSGASGRAASGVSALAAGSGESGSSVLVGDSGSIAAQKTAASARGGLFGWGVPLSILFIVGIAVVLGAGAFVLIKFFVKE